MAEKHQILNNINVVWLGHQILNVPIYSPWNSKLAWAQQYPNTDHSRVILRRACVCARFPDYFYDKPLLFKKSWIQNHKAVEFCCLVGSI